MNKLRVAVLFGGISEEHDVSIKSAVQLEQNLDVNKYEPVFVGITKSGVWKLCEYPSEACMESSTETVLLSPNRSIKGLITLSCNILEVIPIDVVFPMLHGKNGEDGSIQGLLQLSGIPYVGCDVPSSAICMDKSLAYIIASKAGILVPEYWVVTSHTIPKILHLPYPVFVKPARSGSSFGVTKVSNSEELQCAIDSARKYDQKVLIEKAVIGTEVGCAVMGNGASMVTGEVDQISLSNGFFRIHQEKNPEKGSENSAVLVPADLDKNQAERVKEMAKRVYYALGCKGLARVDLFLCPDGRIVLNEVNTMPGFTSYSRFPRMMTAANWTIPDLIDHLICLALEG